MTAYDPVSVVIPALGNTKLLDANLPLLFAEFESRAVGDELVLVDDTGRGELEVWAKDALADRPARLVVRKENGGFAAAMEDGIRQAANDQIFSMNSDVRVLPGFLEPLQDALARPFTSKVADRVFAVAPRVLLNGNQGEIESFARSQLLSGLLTNREDPPRGETLRLPEDTTPIPFAIGGTFLFRRVEFEKLGGFDELFAPFYFEDNDLCWRAWRQGLCSLYVPGSVVEHHHKGTIGALLSPERRRAAVERGELLFNWKHLDDPDLKDHVALLYRRTIDAWLMDDREVLIWLQLALDSFTDACSKRAKLAKAPSVASTRQIQAELERFSGR
ncbi:MAG: glycosyltransferase family 2 protein [Planctomycetota bacterium]|nr:glycosyltransferase family 2 protein [Planctomycetota bacterium]